MGHDTDHEETTETPGTEHTRARTRLERSNSRTVGSKVTNLIKWPKSKEKEKSSANMYVSDTSQV